MVNISSDQLTQYQEQGYLVVEGLLNQKEDLQPVFNEYSALLDSLAAAWFADGKLTQIYPDLPFGERLTRIITESGQAYYKYLDITLPQAGISEDTPMYHGPATFNLLRSPRLLDAVECFIGSEIYSNPVQHIRIKPPERTLPDSIEKNTMTAITPWHQDLGVIAEEADEADILTVWIPITEATLENGCLAVIPGSHKGDLRLHCLWNGIATIPDEFVESTPIPLPMQPGDVLFMTSKTMHTSLPNDSDEIRWSFDLRYNPIGQPTGRPWFPGFVARSRANPGQELTDAGQWADLWRQARSRLAQSGDPLFNRWDADALGCA